MEYPSLDTAKAGAIRFNTDSSQMEIYDGNQWTGILSTSPELQTGGTRGVIASGRSEGGGSQTKINNIQYINIATTGNAVDFGDAIDPNSRGGGTMSSRTRGIITRPSDDDTLEFITIASTGNSQEFGEDSIANQGAVFSNQTRGVNMSGNTSNNSISYITIAQLGNAVDFGDITTSGTGVHGSAGLGNQTRGISVVGRIAPSPNNDGNTMHYVTISTLGNSADYGDLSATTYASGTAANATRGLIFSARNGGSPAQSNMIDFVTIASLGNSVRFGELARSNTPHTSNSGSGVASPTRAVYCGGYGTPASQYSVLNTMEYVQIMTEGNSIDFGDLAQKTKQGASISNGQGGL